MEEARVKIPDRDVEGYLVDPGDWNEAVAEALGREAGIALEGDHWEVIRFMRAYYEERQIAADARFVIRHLESRYPGAGRRRLFELFPYGYVGQACKVAGMKRPRAWSTG
jgi:TusE/DsrC/DsvC family sulfur relay protein